MIRAIEGSLDGTGYKIAIVASKYHETITNGLVRDGDANTMLGFEGDMRRYDFAAQVLQTLGINKIRLMTNNPLKVDELSKCGIEIVERIPVVIDGAPDACLKYLETKRTKMGHF
jgi:GTP cyclohydrolase II